MKIKLTRLLLCIIVDNVQRRQQYNNKENVETMSNNLEGTKMRDGASIN